MTVHWWQWQSRSDLFHSLCVCCCVCVISFPWLLEMNIVWCLFCRMISRRLQTTSKVCHYVSMCASVWQQWHHGIQWPYVKHAHTVTVTHTHRSHTQSHTHGSHTVTYTVTVTHTITCTHTHMHTHVYTHTHTTQSNETHHNTTHNIHTHTQSQHDPWTKVAANVIQRMCMHTVQM